MKIEFEEEDFLKAHREACCEGKKVLENLKPELFKTKYPYLGKSDTGDYQTGKIVLFTQKGEGYVVFPTGTSHLGDFSASWRESVFTPIKGVKEEV